MYFRLLCWGTSNFDSGLWILRLLDSPSRGHVPVCLCWRQVPGVTRGPCLSSLGAGPGFTGAGSQSPAEISPHFRQFPTIRCLVKVAANTRYFIYNINYQWRVVDPNLISVRIPKFIFDFKLWLRLRLSIREALKNHLRFDICLTKSGFLWGFP